MYQVLVPDFMFQDDRGALIQLVHDGYKQFNIVLSKQGIIRGNHYHKVSKEAFYIISGSVDVVLSKDSKEKHVHFQSGDFFEVSPFIIHSMSFPEDCVMVALYDIPIENRKGEKDIWPA